MEKKQFVVNDLQLVVERNLTLETITACTEINGIKVTLTFSYNSLKEMQEAYNGFDVIGAIALMEGLENTLAPTEEMSVQDFVKEIVAEELSIN